MAAGIRHMTDTVEVLSPHAGVAEVVMNDQEHSNQFTRSLVEGLFLAFEGIQRNPEIRAVVVHGYGPVFCTGGTKEELLGIVDGKIQFDSVPLYRLLLDCELPVISAMQGHALGGGLVFGLYADMVILSEESLYSSNFIRYGFTPGMGATLIMPEKLGCALATEMMLTARSYHGGELRTRGVPFPVLKRDEVIPLALSLAKNIATRPTVTLKLLKQALIKDIVSELPDAVRRETEMHNVTFAQPEVRERIEALFGSSERPSLGSIGRGT